jgi:hypothetical protein
MELHNRLRALSSEMGSEIFFDADSLRGALDDYLDEGNASPGEINLLVDAVRLDALRRLLMMVEHGAETSAAVTAAGEQLARDRGSDDVTRSSWACAVLAYALGQVDEAEVLRHRSALPARPAMPVATPPSAPPRVGQPPAGHPSAQPQESTDSPPAAAGLGAAGLGAAGLGAAGLASARTHPGEEPGASAHPSDAPTEPLASGPHGVPSRPVGPHGVPAPTDAPHRDKPHGAGPDAAPPYDVRAQPAAGGSDGGGSLDGWFGQEEPEPEPLPQPFETAEPQRRRAGLLVGLATSALVAATVIAAVLLLDGEPDGAAGPDPSESPSIGPTTGPTTTGSTTAGEPGATIPEENMLVSLTKNGKSRIVSIDVRTGESVRLTDGPADVLPAISPDRKTIVYLERIADDKNVPTVLDVATGAQRPLLDAASPCTSSTRPAWNPSGDKLAIVCATDGVATGIDIIDLDGNVIDQLATSGAPSESPTWISDTQLVYTQLGPSTNSPTTLWSISLDGSSSQLTDGADGLWDSHPDWSEPAGLLMFSRVDGDGAYGNLGALDADLKPVKGGVSQDLLVGHPVWSPDGTEIAFTMLDASETPRLWVGPVDESGEPTMVPGVQGVPGPPVWASR